MDKEKKQHVKIKDEISGPNKEFRTVGCSCGYEVYSGYLAAPIWFDVHVTKELGSG